MKEKRLKSYVGYLKTLVRNFAKCLFIHLLRDENQMVDALAKLSSMWDKPTGTAMKSLVIMKIRAPCYGRKSVMSTQIEPEEKSWFYDIKKFIEERKYPDEATLKEKYALRVLARNYASHDGVLYKRMLNGTQLRCLKKNEADEVMKEIHAGVCGSHMNGIILAKKIVQQGYYWMSMEKDCIQIVRQCHQCQIHGNLNHLPPTVLNNLSSLWPFAAWEIDIIGEIRLNASNGYKYIVVTIDYFSRWIEA